MKKRSERKAEEQEILRKMFDHADSENAGDSGRAPTPEEPAPVQENDRRPCPRCGRQLESRGSCPYCGYNGYVPLTARESRRIKWIVYPIALLAVLLLLYFSGQLR